MENEESQASGPSMLHRGWTEVIKAVTGWLQLVALIILVVESVLIYALYRSPDADPKRIWYVVLMFLFFFGVVTALVIDRHLQTLRHEQKDRELQQTEQAIQDTFESLGKRLLERYGVQAESVSVRAEIDSQGITRYTRVFRGIKVSRDCPVPYIPGSLSISKLGKFQSHFSLLNPKITNSQKAVSLVPGQRTDHLSEFRIKIEGLLHHNDGELTYEIECRADKMFAMTKEEMDEACKDSEFKHEYLSQELDMVVKELEIEVVFPDGFQTTAHPGVFFGQTELMHNLELQNVQLENIGRGAKCKVKDPLIGLSYLIFWTPPPSN